MGNDIKGNIIKTYTLSDLINVHISTLVKEYNSDFLNSDFCDSLQIIYVNKLKNFPIGDNMRLGINIKNTDKEQYCKKVVSHYMDRIKILNKLSEYLDIMKKRIDIYFDKNGTIKNIDDSNASELISFYKSLLYDVDNTITFLINKDYTDIDTLQNICDKFIKNNNDKYDSIIKKINDNIENIKLQAKLMALKHANP